MNLASHHDCIKNPLEPLVPWLYASYQFASNYHFSVQNYSHHDIWPDMDSI